MFTETRTITINDEGLEPWLVQLVRKQALLFPEIKHIFLFGSRATGKKIKPDTDYDLAFETDDTADFRTVHRILHQAETTLKLGKVDFVHMNKTKEALRNIILNEGRAIYVRE